MLTDEEFADFVQVMGEEDNTLFIPQLKDIGTHPTGDARVLSYLRALLDDRRPCLAAIPFHFAERRWLAAKALDAELKCQGSHETTLVENLVIPIPSQALSYAARAHDVKHRGGIDRAVSKSKHWKKDLRKSRVEGERSSALHPRFSESLVVVVAKKNDFDTALGG